MWNGILSIVKVVLALSLLLSLPACDGKKETVKIGLANMPNSINGARLAVEEINTAGGIYQKPLELVIDSMKTSSTPQEAIATAMEFSSRKDILAFIGYTTSSLSLAASQVFNEKGLVQLIPNATSPALSNAGPWTFRVCVNDKLQGAFIADFVVDKLHKQRLAIFYVNDDYGRALKENFVARLQSRKGKVVLEVPYLEGKSFDFESSLPNVQSKNPEMIFFAGRAPRLLEMLQTARQLNINLPVIGGDALYYPTQLFAKGKDMVEGVMMTLFFHPSQKEEGVQKFVQSYWKKYGVMPEAVAALSYDAVYLLKTAMEQGGLSRSKIRDYLATVGSSHPAFKGVTGTIAFDENGDCVKPLVVGVVRHGEIVPLESP